MVSVRALSRFGATSERSRALNLTYVNDVDRDTDLELIVITRP